MSLQITTQKKLDNLNIICLGDSITYGLYNKQGWPDILKNKLSQISPSNRLYNLGIPSCTTIHLAEINKYNIELTARLSSKRQNIIIIAFGANDSALDKTIGKNLVTLEQYQINLEQFIVLANNLNPNNKPLKILLIQTTPVDEAKQSSPEDNQMRCNASISKYNNILDIISRNFDNIEVVKLENFTINYLHQDGLHLNDRGQEFIYQKLLNIL